MDRRFLFALLLSAAIVGLTPWLFPSPTQKPAVTRAAPDSVPATVASPGETVAPRAVPARQPGIRDSAGEDVAGFRADTVFIQTPRAEYGFSTVGASLVSIRIKDYSNQRSSSEKVTLSAGPSPLLRFRLISERDTLALDKIDFHSERSTAESGAQVIRFRGTSGAASVSISYSLDTAGYSARVTGQVTGLTGRTFLLTDLPPTLPSAESDTLDDQGHLAYAFKPENDNASSVGFGRMDPGESKLERGPIAWAAVKNKYFVIGILATKGLPAFSEISLAGAARTSKVATRATATLVQEVREGAFGFDLYSGPQEWKRLVAMGSDFDHVNPYGWAFMRGIVQPVAALVIRSLLWMHEVLRLSYGWVLVIFGVAIRFILWPLNQRAMRSQLKLQDIQPRLLEVQKKYQNNPEKQREEIMKVYRDNGASPLTPLAGCLPMLIPMPIFFALFFVFQNTIEFRGVPFLWLTDISIKDPFYILPLLMGISMYLLSWIGMRNSPPNPQAKMMGYVFPVMMTVMLANLASGLNLYYTAQNIASLPQQWLIARERGKQKVPAR